MKQVKVIISKDGSSVETEVDGVKGEGCVETTASLLAALGTVDESEKRPDYFLVEDNPAFLNQG